MPDNAEWGYVPTVPQTGLVMTLQPGSSACAPTIFTPVGFAPADIAFRDNIGFIAETVETNDEARAVYLGRIAKAYDTATVRINVVVSIVGTDYAEMAICKGTPGVGAAASLTRMGYADATSAFGSTGGRTLSITTSGLAAGDHIWLAWAQKVSGQGATLATFDPATADHLASGVFQYKSATRLSTMAQPSSFAIAAKDLEPLWAVVGMGNA